MKRTANLTIVAAAINGKICLISQGYAFDYLSQNPTRRLLAFILKKSNLKRTSSNLATFQTHTANLTGVAKMKLKTCAKFLLTVKSPAEKIQKLNKIKNYLAKFDF